jgi:6-pyruvoyltetrahydropterin/6-carboxytetrahydropterin synthase
VIRLSRRVRFAVFPWENAEPGHGGNGYAGDPAIAGLCAWYEIELSCLGVRDPAIGYVIDIKRADAAVRSVAVPRIQRAMRSDARASPITLVREVSGELARQITQEVGAIGERVRWYLSPTHSVEAQMNTEHNAAAPVLIRQRFDFAASHRLHVPTLSDEENRRLFGKCNHASGHGHNYQVEPCVEWSGPGSDAGFDLAAFERLVKRVVIDRFDHKHLNLDTPEFASDGGVNPTVENIARVCFGLLSPELAAWSAHSRLRSITVWETDRTSATYPA